VTEERAAKRLYLSATYRNYRKQNIIEFHRDICVPGVHAMKNRRLSTCHLE